MCPGRDVIVTERNGCKPVFPTGRPSVVLVLPIAMFGTIIAHQDNCFATLRLNDFYTSCTTNVRRSKYCGDMLTSSGVFLSMPHNQSVLPYTAHTLE